MAAWTVPSAWAAQCRAGGEVAYSTTDLHPWDVGQQPGAVTAIGWRLPGVAKLFRDDDGPPRLVVADPAGGSWARVEFSPALTGGG